MAERENTNRAAIRNALKVEDEESERAFFTDMRNVKLRLEAGDLTGAKRVLLNRRAALNKIPNADTDDVDRILNRIENEDFSGALEDLTLADNVAVQNEILSPIEQGEGFSLTEGQSRYDAQGNLIANNPRAAESGGGFSLNPGQKRYDSAGNLIANNPADGGDGFTDQRARMIDEYQRLYDLSLEEATRRVDQELRIDPNTGSLIIYDPTSDRARLANVDTGEEPDVIPAPSGINVDDLSFDPGKGTGFGASFLGLWNSTFGQLPLVPEALGAEESAQNLRLLQRDAIRALQSSGRPPVVEQERISSLIPQAMAWTENPEVARFQMTNFVDLMMNQYVDDLRYSSNNSNSKSIRDSSKERAANIESIMRRILTPEASEEMFSQINRVESEMGEINAMTNAQLESVDITSLNDAQLDAYIARLKGQ